MNKHVQSVVPFRKPLEALDRSEIVKSMAEHLVAAILHASLDTSRDQDVIETLLNTPERYQSRVVLNHMDDALFSAKQIIIAREMSNG
jgi:hypothetical protein